MIFIQGDGRIRRIAENTETIWTGLFPRAGRCAVLEVVGTAKKFEIQPGDAVSSPALRALSR